MSNAFSFSVMSCSPTYLHTDGSRIRTVNWTNPFRIGGGRGGCTAERTLHARVVCCARTDETAGAGHKDSIRTNTVWERRWKCHQWQTSVQGRWMASWDLGTVSEQRWKATEGDCLLSVGEHDDQYGLHKLISTSLSTWRGYIYTSVTSHTMVGRN